MYSYSPGCLKLANVIGLKQMRLDSILLTLLSGGGVSGGGDVTAIDRTVQLSASSHFDFRQNIKHIHSSVAAAVCVVDKFGKTEK